MLLVIRIMLIRDYPEQHYKVFFNPQTGFFARVEDKGFAEPFWSIKGPELLDISITNWCDNACLDCYKNSHINALHMGLQDYKDLIIQAKDCNVLQVALGGGNPNQHPDFTDILRFTHEKGIVPSYTTNGRGLSKSVIDATSKYCGAVAISAYEPYELLLSGLKEFNDIGIKPNIHFVLNKDTILNAIRLLGEDSPYLKMCNALVFLNYKPVGKNKDYSKLLKNSDMLGYFFKLVAKFNKCKIGFDSCSVPGILSYMDNINLSLLEPCDASRFSAYVSEDLKMFPCSFMIDMHKGEDLRKLKMIDIWQRSDIFLKTREKLEQIICKECKHQQYCLNGCPCIGEINIC